MKNVLGMLKGSNKYETAENYCIAFVALGAFILAAGIGLTALSTAGISAVLAMLGALIVFIFTVALILSWLAKEILSD